MKVLERTEKFWESLLSGEGIYVENDPAHFEKVDGGKYDVGDIVRQYSRAWLGPPPPNSATPIDVLDLLFFLDDFTTELEAEDLRRRTGNLPKPASCEYMETVQAGYKSICRDLQRWRKRLDEYLMVVSAIPLEEENDRRAILWSVTAPLFVGWYGGETGHEVELPPDAFPPGFNPELRHPPDIATPYLLANQLGVYFAWMAERRRRLVADIKDPLTPETKDYALLAAAGLVVVGLFAFTR